MERRQSASSTMVAAFAATWLYVCCTPGGGGFAREGAFEFANLISQQGGLLELKIVGGFQHLLFEFAQGFGQVEVSAGLVDHRHRFVGARALGKALLDRAA